MRSLLSAWFAGTLILVFPFYSFFWLDTSLCKNVLLRLLWSLFTRKSILTLIWPQAGEDHIQWDKGNWHFTFITQLILDAFTCSTLEISECLFNIFEIDVFRDTCILRMTNVYCTELPQWRYEKIQQIIFSVCHNF